MPFGLLLQEGNDVHGFEVTLPEMLFLKVKGRHKPNSEMKVVLMDITSQFPFQARIWGKDCELFQKQWWPQRVSFKGICKGVNGLQGTLLICCII